jgi:cell division topological specificity factor
MRLIDRMFKPARSSSRQVAKERLQLVLVHDRAQISPQLLETLKDEIIAVISQHVAIEREGVEVTLAQNRRESRLQADIPIVSRPGKTGPRRQVNG